MTTLAEVVTSARQVLNDAGSTDFTDDMIEDWIAQGIRDLNHHFPRRLTDTLTTTAGTHEYDVEISYIAVLSVEYPTGEDPKQFLKHRAYTEQGFWTSEDYYDFIRRFDQLSANPPQLIISASPPAGETITIEVVAEHDIAASPLTILDRHIPIILEYVKWQAWEALAALEGKDPTLTHASADKYKMSAVRAERLYRNALKAAKDAESDSGIVGTWEMDRWGRVY